MPEFVVLNTNWPRGKSIKFEIDVSWFNIRRTTKSLKLRDSSKRWVRHPFEGSMELYCTYYLPVDDIYPHSTVDFSYMHKMHWNPRPRFAHTHWIRWGGCYSICSLTFQSSVLHYSDSLHIHIYTTRYKKAKPMASFFNKYLSLYPP